MVFHIITLFPNMFSSYLNESIIARAIKNKLISVKFYNPRDFVKTKKGYKQIDDKPYGGGPGMVIQVAPVVKAIEKAIKNSKNKTKIIFLSPAGKQFSNEVGKKWMKSFNDVVIICGRYEGIDARVKKVFKAEEISIGPFILTGGELPAMIMIDSVSRQIAGVLGKFESVEENRIVSSDVYTRPEIFEYNGKKYKTPKILLSGHHKKIEEWKKGLSKM